MSRKQTRLQRVIDEIDSADVIADIGTDHGYLPIMAVEQNKTKKAYASDINAKPLESAMKNIADKKMTDSIDAVLTDGLTYYKKNKIKLDYAVISGLGSATISVILNKDYEDIKNYLICSNTEPSSILKAAKKKKLKLVKEDYFIDNGRKYWLINLSRFDGQKIKSFKDIYVGMNTVLENKEYLNYLKNRYLDNDKYLDHLKKWSKRYRFLVKLNKYIEEVLPNGVIKNN